MIEESDEPPMSRRPIGPKRADTCELNAVGATRDDRRTGTVGETFEVVERREHDPRRRT